MIKELKIDDLHLNFKPKLNFLYGLNGSGKSRLIRIIDAVVSGNEIYEKMNNEASYVSIVSTEYKYEYKTARYCKSIVREYKDEPCITDSINDDTDYPVKNSLYYNINDGSNILNKLCTENCTEFEKFINTFIYESVGHIGNVRTYNIQNKFSQGEQRLFSLLAILYDISINNHNAVLLIDDIELHLHVCHQVTLIDFINEYDNIQLICTTHSPEIIGKHTINAIEL